MARTDKALRPIREPVPIAEPGADIGQAIRTLMHSFRHCMDAGLRERGIEASFVHGMVLKNLALEPGLSGAQLARRALVTPQSMNGVLKSMETAQLVVREKHPENRRTDCWYITTIGLRQFEQAGEVIEQLMGRIRGAISKADAARLVELLHQCASALQDSTKE